ncbi:MAG: threonine synthase, partial [Pygmaiobacter sp.]
MNYCSTRDPSIHVTASQAILNGISAEGGLFVPQSIPSIELKDLNDLSYPELAAKILGLFLTDYSQQFLLQATSECYGEKFKDGLAKTIKVADGLYTLELWHGPTCAFKDYALQLMPRLLVEAKRI